MAVKVPPHIHIQTYKYKTPPSTPPTTYKIFIWYFEVPATSRRFLPLKTTITMVSSAFTSPSHLSLRQPSAPINIPPCHHPPKTDALAEQSSLHAPSVAMATTLYTICLPPRKKKTSFPDAFLHPSAQHTQPTKTPANSCVAFSFHSPTNTSAGPPCFLSRTNNHPSYTLPSTNEANDVSSRKIS